MKEVTLVVPAYNEEKRIASAASALLSDPLLREKCRFLFIVDGNDRTGEILEGMKLDGAEASVKKYPGRLGKGGAVAEGIRASSTEYVGFVDVDSSVPIERIGKIISMLTKEGLDCVIGRRVRVEGAPLMRRIGTRGFNALVNLLFGLGISDTQCGCKFFRRKLVYSGGEALRTKGFAFDVELLDRIRRNGGKITEYGFVGKWGERGGFSLLDSPGMFLELVRLRFF